MRGILRPREKVRQESLSPYEGTAHSVITAQMVARYVYDVEGCDIEPFLVPAALQSCRKGSKSQRREAEEHLVITPEFDSLGTTPTTLRLSTTFNVPSIPSKVFDVDDKVSDRPVMHPRTQHLGRPTDDPSSIHHRRIVDPATRHPRIVHER